MVKLYRGCHTWNNHLNTYLFRVGIEPATCSAAVNRYATAPTVPLVFFFCGKISKLVLQTESPPCSFSSLLRSRDHGVLLRRPAKIKLSYHSVVSQNRKHSMITNSLALYLHLLSYVYLLT